MRRANRIRYRKTSCKKAIDRQDDKHDKRMECNEKRETSRTLRLSLPIFSDRSRFPYLISIQPVGHSLKKESVHVSHDKPMGKYRSLFFSPPFLSLKKKRKKKKLLLTPPRPNDSIERNKSWGSEHELGVELSDRTDREEGVR